MTTQDHDGAISLQEADAEGVEDEDALLDELALLGPIEEDYGETEAEAEAEARGHEEL